MALRMGYEIRSRMSTLIFDIVDDYALSRQVGEHHPRPIEPIYFFVTAQVINDVRHPIYPPLELVMTRNQSGYHLFYGAFKMSDGTVRQNVLVPGEYIVRVDTRPFIRPEKENGVPRLYQPVEVKVVLAMPGSKNFGSNSPYSVALHPAPLYPFPHAVTLRKDFSSPNDCRNEGIPVGHGPTLLRGSLHTRDGRPLSGAVVQVLASPKVSAYTTGPDGGWLLIFPEDQSTGPVDLRFSLPQIDGSMADHTVQEVCVVRGYACSLLQAALRGWATDRDRPVTRLNLQIVSTGNGGPYQDLRVISAEGGWFYYLDVDQPRVDDVVTVTASLPDGRVLTEQNVPVRRRATVSVPAFRFQ